jgi:hypothetical protein
MNGEASAVLQGGVFNRSESDGKLNVRVWCTSTFWAKPEYQRVLRGAHGIAPEICSIWRECEVPQCLLLRRY